MKSIEVLTKRNSPESFRIHNNSISPTQPKPTILRIKYWRPLSSLPLLLLPWAPLPWAPLLNCLPSVLSMREIITLKHSTVFTRALKWTTSLLVPTNKFCNTTLTMMRLPPLTSTTVTYFMSVLSRITSLLDQWSLQQVLKLLTTKSQTRTFGHAMTLVTHTTTLLRIEPLWWTRRVTRLRQESNEFQFPSLLKMLFTKTPKGLWLFMVPNFMPTWLFFQWIVDFRSAGV